MVPELFKRKDGKYIENVWRISVPERELKIGRIYLEAKPEKQMYVYAGIVNKRYVYIRVGSLVDFNSHNVSVNSIMTLIEESFNDSNKNKIITAFDTPMTMIGMHSEMYINKDSLIEVFKRHGYNISGNGRKDINQLVLN